jgi:hypothetical protein
MIEEQVDVGVFTCFTARRRSEKRGVRRQAVSYQIGFVGPEFGNGLISFHVRRRFDVLTAAVDDCPYHGSEAFSFDRSGLQACERISATNGYWLEVKVAACSRSCSCLLSVAAAMRALCSRTRVKT